MGHTSKTKIKIKSEAVKAKLRLKKKLAKKNKHRARLIVRNLPFATTEENLREHFEKFGELDEVKLLKKEDGSLLGCGFVQYKLRQKAAKAIHHLNGKDFLNRKIECDWALPKDQYDKKKELVETVEIKEEPIDDGYEVYIKTENEDEVKVENEETEVDTKLEVKEDIAESDVIGGENENEDEVEYDMDGDYNFNAEDKFDAEDNEKNFILDEDKPERKTSNDAAEGKTIFIKNVPFTATNDDISYVFGQFGPLQYALVCMDPLTEHSKGTGFVKFMNKEDADNCLATPEITLMGNTLECQHALTKDELRNRNNSKDNRQRDSRNLYLVKEGVVLAGTKAAGNVSASDMAKRLQLEQYKTQMLKDLNMFIARTRLIVHNIPPGWDDSKLRALFKKYSSSKGIIKEARIMRNMRIVDAKGMGKSKEFGFVTYTTHEAALEALRAINNNPNIFSISKRPIVAFSIENRARLNAKEKRLENSKMKNPNYKKFKPIKGKKQTQHQKGPAIKKDDITEQDHNKFTGVTAKPGKTKMRSRFNIKTQANIHLEQLKKEKKKKKMAKKTLEERQQEFTKQPRQKINKKKLVTSDNFSKLVNEYKQKLLKSSESAILQKKKWFEAE